MLELHSVSLSLTHTHTGNYSTGPRQSRQGLAKDFPDGRGNVDEDSDEEKEEPEAFQPQYESLPALRPAQPPQYKPSPAYIQGYGMSILIDNWYVPNYYMRHGTLPSYEYTLLCIGYIP